MSNALRIESRLMFLSIALLSLTYGPLLYFLPTQTAVYWAWVIPQTRSAMLIGGIYLGALAYYILAPRENDWSAVRNGIGGQFLFSIVLLIAASLHWDNFRPYHPTTFIWLAIYYGGPLFLPILYRLQGARSQVTAPDEVKIAPAWGRWLIGRGVVYLAFAVLGIIFAEALSAIWPWSIEPINLRVFMGLVAVVGWNGISPLWDGLFWRHQRLSLILIGGAGVVQLVALLINSTPYNWSSPFGIILPLIFLEWIVTPLVLFYIYEKR